MKKRDINPEAAAVLESILSKMPSELTGDEVLFLRARRSYLTPAEQDEFKSVLEVEIINQTRKDGQHGKRARRKARRN